MVDRDLNGSGEAALDASRDEDVRRYLQVLEATALDIAWRGSMIAGSRVKFGLVSIRSRFRIQGSTTRASTFIMVRLALSV